MLVATKHNATRSTDLLRMYAALGRLPRKPRQRFMKRFRVWHKDDPAYHGTFLATTSSRARSKFLDSVSGMDHARYIDLRCSMEAVLYPLGEDAPAEEQFALSTMRHALGLNNYGGGDAYRNYYTSGPECSDYASLMALCAGVTPRMHYRLPEEGGYTIFHVTLIGKEWVDKRLGLKSRA